MKFLLYALVVLMPTVHCSLKTTCCKEEVSASELVHEPVCVAIVGAAGVTSLAAAPLALGATGFIPLGVAGLIVGVMGGAFDVPQPAVDMAVTPKAVIESAAAASVVKLCCAAVTC